MYDPNWRMTVLASAFVILFSAYALRFAVELVKPVLWFLCPGLFVVACGYLYWRWRRQDW